MAVEPATRFLRQVRPSAGLREGVLQVAGDRRLLIRPQKAAEFHAAAMRDERQALDAIFLVFAAVDPHPEGIEAEFLGPAAHGNLVELQFQRREAQVFVGAGGAEGELERKPDRHRIQPEEADDRPGAEEKEGQADAADRHADDGDQRLRLAACQRAVRAQPDGVNRLVVGFGHGCFAGSEP